MTKKEIAKQVVREICNSALSSIDDIPDSAFKELATFECAGKSAHDEISLKLILKVKK